MKSLEAIRQALAALHIPQMHEVQDRAEQAEIRAQFHAVTQDPALVARCQAALEVELQDGSTLRQAAARVLARVKRGYPPERPTPEQVMERWCLEHGIGGHTGVALAQWAAQFYEEEPPDAR